MDIYNDVVERLSVLGYTVNGSDTAVTYSINRAAETIKANINHTEIPEGLRYVLVDMSAGLFLQEKKATGQLGEEFDFSSPAMKISEGDVTVEFAGATDGAITPEARFDGLLKSLINPPQSVYAAFRRLKW
jgi:hypothetical protein